MLLCRVAFTTTDHAVSFHDVDFVVAPTLVTKLASMRIVPALTSAAFGVPAIKVTNENQVKQVIVKGATHQVNRLTKYLNRFA